LAIDTTLLLLGIDNLADAAGAVVSCGNEVATLPASNLRTTELGEVFRTQSTSPSNTKIVVDLGSAKAVDTIDLRLHNLRASATYQVEAANDAGFSSLLYGPTSAAACGAVDGWERNALTHLITGGAVTARYWRLSLSDSGNPAGYLEAARIALFAAWQPPVDSNNFSYGMSNTPVDPSLSEQAPGGSVFHDVMPWYRQVQLVPEELSDAASRDLFARLAPKGNHGDILVMPFPALSQFWHLDNVWGFLEPAPHTNPNFARWSREIKVRERTASA